MILVRDFAVNPTVGAGIVSIVTLEILFRIVSLVLSRLSEYIYVQGVIWLSCWPVSLVLNI